MESEIYLIRVHRPVPHLLVGFLESDHQLAAYAIKEAIQYMTRRMIGADGLTDSDRKKIEYARRLIFDWREIARLAKEADTEKCREILRQEVTRAYESEKRQKKLQYKD